MITHAQVPRDSIWFKTAGCYCVEVSTRAALTRDFFDADAKADAWDRFMAAGRRPEVRETRFLVRPGYTENREGD